MLRENDPKLHLPGQRERLALELPHSKPVADRHLWQIVPVRDLLFLGLGCFLLWFGYYLRGVFTPVLIALMLAYLVNPLVGYAEARWRAPRPLTVVILLVLMVAAASGFGAWLGPLLAEQAQTLAKKTPQYVQSLSGRYGIQFGSVSEQISAFITRFHENPMDVIEPLLTGTSQAFGVIGQVIGTTTQAVLFTVLIPVYFFFFAWQFDRMLAALSRFLPESHRERWVQIFHRMDQAISGFFRGRLVIAALTGVMYAIGWAAADVPYWFLLGIGTGLLTIVPYLSLIGWPLAILLKYLDMVTASGASAVAWLPVAVWPTVAYLAVQFIESWVLTPWIQSQSTDMSAVTVLIVVFIGGAVGGMYGLLLAIPIAACIKILFQELILPKLERWAAEH